MNFLEHFAHFMSWKIFSWDKYFWLYRFFKILKNDQKLKFSKASTAKNICPMKKFFRAKNSQNVPKNSFLGIKKLVKQLRDVYFGENWKIKILAFLTFSKSFFFKCSFASAWKKTNFVKFWKCNILAFIRAFKC